MVVSNIRYFSGMARVLPWNNGGGSVLSKAEIVVLDILNNLVHIVLELTLTPLKKFLQTLVVKTLQVRVNW